MRLQRRSFLELSLGAAVGATLSAQATADSTADGDQPLRAPQRDQVTTEAGIPKTQQQNSLAILAGFDANALLKPYREMGGLPAPGKDLGGWYNYNPSFDWHGSFAGLAPGHAFGQWTSAMARFALAQRDPAARDRVLHLQRLLGDAITPDYFDKHRYPAYVLDKLNCGLLDAYTLSNSPQIFAVLDKVRRCALPTLPGYALERLIPWRKDRDYSFTWDENYTLPENLYLLYRAGAGDEYRTMARAYLFDSFFDPLSRGENVLGGLHAYSHANALCSAMQAWFVDGSRKHLQAAVNGHSMIQAQSFATGGWGPDETFEKPGSGWLLKSLTATHQSFETPCGTYAFLKLSRYLLMATRDGRYGDAMERVLWNSMFGVLPLQPDGRAFYYADVSISAQRSYSVHRWPCCAGTYTQVAADYGINTWLLGPPGDNSVWVNLYLPSTLEWNHAGARLRLTQLSGYPANERVSLRLETTRPTRFALHLRIPAWCQSSSLQVNGQPVAVRTQRGFAALDRTWRNGDRIELHLPATLRLERLPTDTGKPQNDLAALCWGPWVLLPLAPEPSATANELLAAERSGDLEWRVQRSVVDLYLRPFFAVGDGTYATYIRLT